MGSIFLILNGSFIYTRGGSFVNFNNDNKFLLYTHTHTRPRQKNHQPSESTTYNEQACMSIIIIIALRICGAKSIVVF